MKRVHAMRFVICLGAFLVAFLALPSSAHQVIEKYRSGNYIEGCTYISTGTLAGKLAFIDGWYIYCHDFATGEYKKLCCYANVSLGMVARGICYISQGTFEGNFLLDDPTHTKTLYVISPTGAVIAEVTASDFEWDEHCEGITEITSGPYAGKYALIGRTSYRVFHVFIFRIEHSGGSYQAILEKDVTGGDLDGYLSYAICFLPGDFADPLYQNHLVLQDISTLNLDVIDLDGNIVATFPGDEYYEGLAYLSSGLHQGEIATCDGHGDSTWIRKLDATEINAYDIQVGIGVAPIWSITWYPGQNQLLFAKWQFPNDLKFQCVFRSAPDTWMPGAEYAYTGLRYSKDLAIAKDGRYYILGYDRESLINIFKVHKLDQSFSFETSFNLTASYPGISFNRICYLPGEASDDDQFALLAVDNVSGEQSIYLFDGEFDSPTAIIDLLGAPSISDLCYDEDKGRAYMLSSQKISVYNAAWNEIGEMETTSLFPRSFSHIEKVLYGDLVGSFILLEYDSNEMYMVRLGISNIFDGHDFDADATSDIAVWRPLDGNWHIKDVTSQNWGQENDIPVNGDYDGNSSTDIAVWRQSSGQWFVKNQFAIQWGTSGDVPVPGKYDADTATDIAVWRPFVGIWYIKDIADVQWGADGDIPVPGDFNADGLTNIAVWRPSSGIWYIKDIGAYQWGALGDIPVPGDYNGDGLTDMAVFRPSVGIWFIHYMGGGADSIFWGTQGDLPVPGDYDGNGTTDVAIWRPADGLWYIYGGGTVQYGMSGDIPLVR